MKSFAILTSLLLFCTNCFVGAQDRYNMEEIDSMEKILATNPQDTLKLELLKKLSSNVLDQRKGLNYILEAKKIHNKLKLPYDDNIDYKLGFLYFVNRKDDKAFDVYKKLEKYYENKDSVVGKIRVYYYLARINSRKANIDKSSEYYNKALNLVDSAEVDSLKDFIYNGLGYFYMSHTHNLDKAREFFKKGLAVSISESDDFGYMQSMLALSRLELAARNVRKSFEYANDALDTALLKKDTLALPAIYNTMGNIYEVTEQFEKALAFYKNSLKINYEINDGRDTYVSYINISDVFFKQNKLDSAESYLIKSMDVAVKINSLMDQANIHSRLHELYAKKKNFEKAYKHTLALMKTWQNIQAEKIGIMQAEMKLESDLVAQEKEFKILKQQADIQQLQLNKNRYFIIALSAMIVLIIAGAFIFIKHNKGKTSQKINELTHRNLRQQMNPHFIFNTLNSIQYFLFKNKKMEANNYLSKFASLMRKLLDNSQFQSIPINQEIEALNIYIELESLRFKDKIEYSIEVDENIDVFEYKIPTMILQPYVENAINHGLLNKEGKGILQVRLSLENENILCEVEDNGIGRVKANEIKFTTNSGHKSLASKITESRLKLMSNLYGSKFHVDIIDLEDNDGNCTGTKVCLTMPVLT